MERKACSGLVDGCSLRCDVTWHSECSFELRIEGHGNFFGWRDSAGTFLFGPAAGNVPEAVVLGPPLLLTLALHGVFCLHASAVTRDRELALFLGESGAGKSTLAASFAHRGWHRLADDLLPFERTSEGELIAFVDFPQLKVGSRQGLPPRRNRVPAEGQGATALGRIFQLQPPQRAEADLHASSLAPAAAVAALLQATVPWPLLSSNQSQIWLSALCEAVRQPTVRVSRWVYPHRPACLDQAFLEAS